MDQPHMQLKCIQNMLMIIIQLDYQGYKSLY
jgi:hypothetical protein